MDQIGRNGRVCGGVLFEYTTRAKIGTEHDSVEGDFDAIRRGECSTKGREGERGVIPQR